MLGVSPVTLRTWDRRYGLGPSTREEGRHRRYSEEDVARLRRMLVLTGRGVSPASAAAAVLAAPGGEVGPRAVEEAAELLDVPLLGTLSSSLIARDGVVRAWEDVLVPFLVALGERVAATGSGVEVEHLASAAISRALRAAAPVAGSASVLLACAPEEQHSLPLDALAAALTERDCGSWHLGARVPARALLDAVNSLAPRVVFVWAHAPACAVLAPVSELLERGLPVLLGGPGWVPVPPGARWFGSLGAAVTGVLELNRF